MSINFINTVVSAYPYPEDTVAWVHKALRPNASREAVENQAAKLLSEIEEKNPRTDKTRYRFNHEGTKREQLLNTIFHLSYKAKPDSIIDAATKFSPQLSCYPKWKKVCLIQIPKRAIEVLENKFFQFALMITSLYLSYKACHLAYKATVSLVTRIAPQILNRVPPLVTHAINGLTTLKNWVNTHKVTLALGALFAHQVATRGIEIPYISAQLRKISLRDVIISLVFMTIFPNNIATFAIFTAIKVGGFAEDACKNLANSLKAKVTQAESARLALSKEKVYTVWKGVVA